MLKDISTGPGRFAKRIKKSIYINGLLIWHGNWNPVVEKTAWSSGGSGSTPMTYQDEREPCASATWLPKAVVAMAVPGRTAAPGLGVDSRQACRSNAWEQKNVHE
jgi:hypothetical protein